MIWIFDSGIGWLSVRKEIVKLMPNQRFCYIADSAFCPYWRKSPEELQKRTKTLTEFLINQWDCDLIVVACNTATAAAIEYLRTNFEIPFVWMEPAIKPALLQSKTWVVWVLATAGTFKWALYHRTLTQFQWDIKVIEEVWDWLVELVEQDKMDSKEAYDLLKKYIEPMTNANVDHIVLWCTHYPFLQPAIEKILDEKWLLNQISIINPAPAVALQTQRILNSNNGNHKNINWSFYSTGNEIVLQTFIKKIISDFPDYIKKDTFPCLKFSHLDIQ